MKDYEVDGCNMVVYYYGNHHTKECFNVEKVEEYSITYFFTSELLTEKAFRKHEI